MKSFLFFIMLLFIVPVFSQNDVYEVESYEKRITRVYIDGVYIPENLQDALKELDKKVEPEGRRAFATLSEEEAASKLFFSFGRWMMYNWGMEDGSRISHYFREQGVGVVEDMARILMVSYHRHIRQNPLETEDLMLFYKEKRKKELEARQKELLKNSRKLDKDSNNRGQ